MDLTALGVTPQQEKKFNKKGIFSAEDLVEFLPRKYRDFRNETGILPETETSCVVVRADKMYSPSQYNKVPYFRVNGIVKATGRPIVVTFFNQGYRQRELAPYMGRDFFLAGKISYSEQYFSYQVTSPELFVPLNGLSKRIYPVYSKIPNMSDDYLAEKMKLALGIPSLIEETLPRKEVESRGLMSRREAITALHMPTSMEQIDEAQKRLTYDSLLYFAIHNEWEQMTSSPVSPACIIQTAKTEQLISSLPYELTPDQQAAIQSMLKDAKEHKRIHALIQGDVGCGKTIIAVVMMSYMAENGYQAVLMAPTQVLAKQHYEEVSALLAPFGIHVAYLGSELKAKDKKSVCARIANGDVHIVIGTHSVLSDSVQYKKLGLTVVDEEHRFGVAQRAALVAKAAEGVHSITMSATPIPRTQAKVAQVVHGQTLQLYSIHTKPAGRKEIKTGLATTREKLYNFIIREARNGHQTYVVCPLIDDSDSDLMAGVKSVETVSAEYKAALEPHGIRIGTLTGRNKKDETAQIIDQFKNGGLDVLIATTVVEVGVNVPTATLMVISNAERFGLASLHQLRGRVGRSDLPAFCVLDSNDQSEKAQERLNVLVNCQDGFDIAEADLKLRGAGDLLGTKQSGENKYLTLVMENQEMYEDARVLARKMLDENIQCPMMFRIQQEREEAAKQC